MGGHADSSDDDCAPIIRSSIAECHCQDDNSIEENKESFDPQMFLSLVYNEGLFEIDNGKRECKGVQSHIHAERSQIVLLRKQLSGKRFRNTALIRRRHLVALLYRRTANSRLVRIRKGVLSVK